MNSYDEIMKWKRMDRLVHPFPFGEFRFGEFRWNFLFRKSKWSKYQKNLIVVKIVKKQYKNQRKCDTITA